MRQVTIYTRPMCPYCMDALELLHHKGAPVHEIKDAAFDPAARSEMLRRSNGRATYPQIFIGEQHVGGCDDLYALERAGKLDALLEAA